MRYLVDTQIFIWTLISPEKLSVLTRQILQNNEIFVSQISLFEIAIKQKIGKLPEFPLTITLLAERIEQDNFNLLRPLHIPFKSRKICILNKVTGNSKWRGNN